VQQKTNAANQSGIGEKCNRNIVEQTNEAAQAAIKKLQ
jgi:hypothetical protein